MCTMITNAVEPRLLLLIMKIPVQDIRYRNNEVVTRGFTDNYGTGVNVPGVLIKQRYLYSTEICGSEA